MSRAAPPTGAVTWRTGDRRRPAAAAQGRGTPVRQRQRKLQQRRLAGPAVSRRRPGGRQLIQRRADHPRRAPGQATAPPARITASTASPRDGWSRRCRWVPNRSAPGAGGSSRRSGRPQYHQAMEHIRGKLRTGVRTISTASCVAFMPGNTWGGRSQQAEDPLDSPRISVRTRPRAAA